MATKNELIQRAYDFFPRGIVDNTEAYANTKENKNLVESLKKGGKYLKILTKLSEQIASHGQNVIYEDLNSIFVHYRCAKGRFDKNDFNGRSLLIYISILVPYYVIYESDYSKPPNHNQGLDHKFWIKTNISPEYLDVHSTLVKNLKQLLPEYSELDETLFQAEVNDIIFNGNGKLDRWHNSPFCFPMTIFNVFFSDNYF